LEDRERLLRDFNACAVWVETGEPGQYCRDRDDDHFIEAVLKAQADYLVSGDKDLLEAHPVQGLRVVSVHQALEALDL
jgi:putative PIN family toxin of toxin-antitoxin system